MSNELAGLVAKHIIDVFKGVGIGNNTRSCGRSLLTKEDHGA
ncbi:hypothetical protein CA13_01560 [Planctomycetes bacterium CA13]|uniref:Uncharacterized protein n=1 Tax=Novipirellula herctigrandis TaxID=2527986 RepID=A0A5C5YUP7_9BACT|nr:hypothetical protein CA13_01560 [Planctomycetes bacterium CA13]